MSNILFIRHGQCIANIGVATSFAFEAKLTERGWQEAYAIAEHLSRISEHESIRIFSSPYIRALETAKATQDLFGGKQVHTLPVHEFDYLDLSREVATTTAQRSPLVKEYWGRCRPHYRHNHKAESFIDFISRVQRVVNALWNPPYIDDEFVVIFSHHLFIQAVRWLSIQNTEIQAKNLQPSDMRDFHDLVQRDPIPTGAIIKTTSSQRGYHLPPKIEIETEHLHNSATR
jgi:2,3-bisphosphoglycerate-dependent phosphoglycerate mutase